MLIYIILFIIICTIPFILYKKKHKKDNDDDNNDDNNKPIGGCAGTRYGCCHNGTTPKPNYYSIC